MEILKNNELMDITGGAIKIGLVTAIVAISVTVIGIIDGIFMPQACRVK